MTTKLFKEPDWNHVEPIERDYVNSDHTIFLSELPPSLRDKVKIGRGWKTVMCNKYPKCFADSWKCDFAHGENDKVTYVDDIEK